jgi:hypothetical protein
MPAAAVALFVDLIRRAAGNQGIRGGGPLRAAVPPLLADALATLTRREAKRIARAILNRIDPLAEANSCAQGGGEDF